MSGLERHWYPLTAKRQPAQRRVVRKVRKAPIPVDPLTGPKLALGGRVVTMDDAFTVKPDAIVYIDRGGIVAVQDRARAAAAGFEDVTAGQDRRHALPGIDRAAQPPQLQRPAAVEPGAEAASSTAASGPTTRTTAS